jgi:uncharacterized membrane protein YphA (DoxX/SURF4 family)
MRYDVIGCTLLGISAFLYAARYITAAIFMGAGLGSWNRELFQAAYQYVGDDLTTWASIAFVAGLLALAVGIVSGIVDYLKSVKSDRSKRSKKEI